MSTTSKAAGETLTNAPTTKSFAISPAAFNDIPALIDVQFSAFAGEPYHEAIYPGGQTEVVRTGAVTRLEKEWAEDSKYGRWVKCCSTNGTVVGYAKWDFYDVKRPEVEWRTRHAVDWCEGREKEKAEAFLGATAGIRERFWGGRRHALCAMLCVRSDYQRQGAGSLLMQWGIAEAKRLGLPTYLESSSAGYPLYLALGFREVDKFVIKAEQWDGDRDLNYIAMLLD